jgi:hypothetical protein
MTQFQSPWKSGSPWRLPLAPAVLEATSGSGGAGGSGGGATTGGAAGAPGSGGSSGTQVTFNLDVQFGDATVSYTDATGAVHGLPCSGFQETLVPSRCRFRTA